MCIDQTILVIQYVTSLWLSAAINIYRYGSKSCNNNYTVLGRLEIIKASQTVCIDSSYVYLQTPTYIAAITYRMQLRLLTAAMLLSTVIPLTAQQHHLHQ